MNAGRELGFIKILLRVSMAYVTSRNTYSGGGGGKRGNDENTSEI